MSPIGSENGATPKAILFWDDDNLKRDDGDFKRLLNVPVSGTPDPVPSNSADNIASDPKSSDHGSETHSAAGDWEIFVPEDSHCGTWDKSPNKHRHASFGDKGTTASTNCYGDLIQMSQHLTAGRSGVFTIDDTSVREPYLVEIRSQDLENFSRTSGFGLYMPPESVPNEQEPPEVKWVNWRWPRYEYTYKTEHGGAEVRACFQYMVHKGVVLQQFTLENTGEKSSPVGPFSFTPNHLIRDLDFLKDDYSFNKQVEQSKEYLSIPAPNEYGYICVHRGAQDLLVTGSSSNNSSENPNDKSSAVASAITIFVDGSATMNQPKHFLKRRNLGHKDSGQNKLQIVIAYKLFLMRGTHMPWMDFVVSAEDANINHWLREERELLWGPNDNQTHCLTALALSTVDSRENNKEATDKKNHATFKMPSDIPTESSNPLNHLDYFAWRHLEHILSVCAIPVSLPGKPHAKESAPPIALTCGDMCGHRINTSASFFAFKFLIDVALRIRTVKLRGNESHVQKFFAVMEKRIVDTCDGHIRWLQLLRSKNEPRDSEMQTPPTENLSNDHIMQAGCFAANYWITGDIMPADSRTWQPENSMMDTALQILKVEDYKELYKSELEGKAWLTAKALLDDLYIPWLTELNKLDIRGTFTWPHRKVENINTFRLDDHFWVWKALNFLHAHVPKISPPRRHAKTAKFSQGQKKWIPLLYLDKKSRVVRDYNERLKLLQGAIREFMTIAKRLSPINVQRGILQRFTTAEDVSKERMLAVTRSAGQNRFLLHARDTVLIYGEEGGFFSENGSRQLWENTKRAQPHHEENLTADWGITLRYALGIAMGVRNCTLNASSAPDLVKRCVRILISSTGSDAFFPGFLDELGNEPTNFGDESNRDSFYRAGFEIHYVLLSSASRIAREFYDRIERKDWEESKKDAQPLTTTSDEKTRSDQDTARSMASSDQVSSGSEGTNTRSDPQPTLLMKKSSPFTNTILATNCNTFKDEWLYKYPDFLRGGESSREHVQSFLSGGAGRGPKDAGFLAEAIEQCSRDFHFSPLDEGDRICHPEQSRPSHLAKECAVLDREKKKNLGRGHKYDEDMEEREVLHDHCEMLEYLGRPRSVRNAKKRLIGLRAADLKMAFVNWFVSPERERQPISKFLDRHARCDKGVWYRTSLVFNEWQTELHLSFYLLVEGPVEGGIDLLSTSNRQSLIPFPGKGKQDIRRASMSFRFDGDFFDRYWTCHVVQSIPVSNNTTNEDVLLGLEEADLIKQRWQRKVLELYFLNRILDNIVRASKCFPSQVRKELPIQGYENKSLAMENLLEIEETDSTSMKKWQEFERILQLVEEDLSSVLSTVQKWNRRESERGNERPRWTQSDENKYRTIINKLQGQTQIATVNLEVSRDAVRKLGEFLSASRKSCRDERDRKRAARESLQNENIRYFTYSTVIFLPLGFATSFYSMGGPPDGGLIVSLVEFAVAALTATFFVVLAFTLFFKKLEKRDPRPGNETSSESGAGNSGKSQESGVSFWPSKRRPWRRRKHAEGEGSNGSVQV